MGRDGACVEAVSSALETLLHSAFHIAPPGAGKQSAARAFHRPIHPSIHIYRCVWAYIHPKRLFAVSSLLYTFSTAFFEPPDVFECAVLSTNSGRGEKTGYTYMYGGGGGDW